MTDPTTRTKKSEVIMGIYIHVYTDGSGGFFSLKDGEPEPLIHLVQDSARRSRIQKEFDVFQQDITGV